VNLILLNLYFNWMFDTLFCFFLFQCTFVCMSGFTHSINRHVFVCVYAIARCTVYLLCLLFIIICFLFFSRLRNYSLFRLLFNFCCLSIFAFFFSLFLFILLKKRILLFFENSTDKKKMNKSFHQVYNGKFNYMSE